LIGGALSLSFLRSRAVKAPRTEPVPIETLVGDKDTNPDRNIFSRAARFRRRNS
jgi:hypothetical protein